MEFREDLSVHHLCKRHTHRALTTYSWFCDERKEVYIDVAGMCVDNVTMGYFRLTFWKELTDEIARAMDKADCREITAIKLVRSHDSDEWSSLEVIQKRFEEEGV